MIIIFIQLAVDCFTIPYFAYWPLHSFSEEGLSCDSYTNSAFESKRTFKHDHILYIK